MIFRHSALAIPCIFTDRMTDLFIQQRTRGVFVLFSEKASETAEYCTQVHFTL